MEEMVEPDRTIMIVSIIGLAIIWGSVLYHKFAQGNRPPAEKGPPEETPEAAAAGGEAETPAGQKKRKKKR